MKWTRVVLGVVGSVWVLSIGLPLVARSRSRRCLTEPVSERYSPDRAYRVVVAMPSCGGPPTGTAQVLLAEAGEPWRTGRELLRAEGLGPGEGVEVLWLGSTRVVLRYSRRAEVRFAETRAGSIVIAHVRPS